MKTKFILVLLATLWNVRAAEPVFSGPQPGEKATPFKVLELTGDGAGREREVSADAATALVFVHGIERSLVPLLRVVDNYGAERKERIKTEIIFLSADRLEGEQRVKAAAGSLKLKSRIGLSLDGAEGPGNYGLNKECLMTIVAAKDGKVAANFALVQPGIADGPKVIAALAKACSDDMPPAIEQLAGNQNAAAMRRDGAKPTENFPGAVPTDEKLVGLLRRFIRPTNDDATVDAVLDEVRAHIRDNAGLKKQAMDGWTRILHFGDRYGSEHARKVGREFLEKLKAETK
jgi:hypothetical protein